MYTQLLDQLIYSTEDSELQGLVNNLIDNSSLVIPMDVSNDVPLNAANIADVHDINDTSAVDDAPNAEDPRDGNQAEEAMYIADVGESNDASVVVADALNSEDPSNGNQPKETNYNSDSDSVTSDILQSTTVTSCTKCITLKLVKKTTIYHDGSKDTLCETDIGYSNNVDPATIDITLIAEEIVWEVSRPHRAQTCAHGGVTARHYGPQLKIL